MLQIDCFVRKFRVFFRFYVPAWARELRDALRWLIISKALLTQSNSMQVSGKIDTLAKFSAQRAKTSLIAVNNSFELKMGDNLRKFFRLLRGGL